jgi:FKBP-type peptidyl-prolyl cis-trans isomerase SlyD
MKVENGKTVAVHYRLHLDGFEGELFEETTEDQPLEFAIGAGEMIPAFEAAIMGMEAGQEFQIHIPCADAYGEEKEEFYMEFPKSDFIAEDGEMDDELFEVGEVVPMNTPEGEEVYGVVVEVKLNSIVIDFNHPLADEDLYFTGVIAQVQ